MGIKVFIVECVWNAKTQLQLNKVFWRLELTIGTSHEFESQANCLTKLEVLSYSAIVGVTLQLPCILHMCALVSTYQLRASREIQSQSPS